MLARLGSLFFMHLPPDNVHWYRLCRRYVDAYSGENNDDMRTNGELHFLRQTLTNCETVFDVGANVGNWAELALQINPRLRLHCFEPSQPTFLRLLAKAFPPHVVCNPFGLGSAQGERTLYVFDEGSGLNSLYRRQGLEAGYGLTPQQRTETAHLDTLDHYCQKHGVFDIDLLKADVEGHELEVFKGAKQMLAKRRIKIIQFEYGGCNIDARVLLKDFFDFFQPHGYAFYKIYPKELRRVERYDQRFEDFQYQNWIVTRID